MNKSKIHYSFRISTLVPGCQTVKDIGRDPEKAKMLLENMQKKLCEKSGLSPDKIVQAFNEGRVKVKGRNSKFIVVLYV